MSPTVAGKRRLLRRELLCADDPFALLADCIQQNEELKAEVMRLRRLLHTGKN